MATLQGKAIKDTYKDLLQVSTNNNTGVTTAMSTVEDGEGTSSALEISTSAVRVAGNLEVTGQVTGVPHVDYRGNYSSSTAYVKDDVVFFNGSSYIAKQSSSGNSPTNTTFWGLLAQKGTDGSDGSSGSNGSNGTDGADGADGQGFTGGSYNASTGVVTFTSNDGLGFSTGDLRGADGADGGATTNLNNLDDALTADSSGNVVINEDGADADFRVEGDTDSNLLLCNAGEDNVGVGKNPSNTFKFDVWGGSSHPNVFNVGADNAGGGVAQFLRNSSTSGSTAIFQMSANPNNNATSNVNIDLQQNSNNNFLQLSFGGGDQCAFRFDNTADGSNKGTFFPHIHDKMEIGKPSIKWKDIWVSAVNAGSDVNIKQDIEDISEAEKRVAVKAKGLLKKYRMINSVNRKGDDARIHFGVIAQELQEAFESENLDPWKYSMLGKDTWYEKEEDGEVIVSNEAKEGYTEVTRMSVRYFELFAFVMSAL